MSAPDQEPQEGQADQTPLSSQAASSAEPVRVNHRLRNLLIAGILVIAVVLAAFFGIRVSRSGHESAAKGSKSNPVLIGVVGANNEQWKVFKAEAQKEGIYVELKNFTDYTSENPALAQGSLDLNEFQHILYLANYNVKNNQNLQPIGGTAVFPLGLYSKNYKKVSQIPAGSTIAIPNDETNQARALGVLKSAGLITLKGGWTAFSSPNDVDTAKSKVKVKAVEAAKVANSLSDPSIAAGVVNNDYVKDAGINPTDAIYQDSAASESSKPYINVWVARKADAKNPLYLKLVKIFHKKTVTDALMRQSGNQGTLNYDSAADLQKILSTVEKQARQAGEQETAGKK
ncbi:NLPA lipoprotein [Scardovia inopinata]|uniref:YaeC family lipoprotein n=1 Tax=Scardovia inopinata F0304 TaxID=641146 RepID=W5IIC1_SCAIO|nr:MetQ/NlpA family ABC transporter substrate-binding protein [Scardovia inopinata]EFG26747.1 YaeC family lipoprotein [Scardovia inopinata F0304]BAR06351.1 putative metal ABC transporter substrate binding component [Scardovia inopinata JCM 12537]SUV51868.1 NLPA lipoprotein [Scardovia inopinata]